MKCGLLGKKLGHSFSPKIHSMLGDYEYVLFEKNEEELTEFIRNGGWSGINVTIPYKKEVYKLLDECSTEAKSLESVNTVVRRNGKLYGDNTDVYGFNYLLEYSGVDVNNRKVLVLGSGGASVSVKYVLEKKGANVVIISRTGPDNYNNLERHYDASAIVNTTPVGMYPDNLKAPLDVKVFTKCEAVFDIVYNPLSTKLILDAKACGIKTYNGIRMLVAQALRSSEIFTDSVIDVNEIERINAILSDEMSDIVLIGMPGCGKTTVAAELSLRTGKPVYDCDGYICEQTGRTPAEIIREDGEEAFRIIETNALKDLCRMSGVIISTGGGCVTRSDNYPILHQNGKVIRLVRDLDLLAVEGRPLSEKNGIVELAKKREEMYREFADIEVNNNLTPSQTAEKIVGLLKNQ